MIWIVTLCFRLPICLSIKETVFIKVLENEKNNMNITTPNEISEEILEFCGEIDSTTKPVFLEFFQVDGYIPGECYGNVEKHIEKNGGDVQYGWIIWEDSKIFLEAEFHAIWVNKKGGYIDVTPKIDKEDRVLFLPDSERRFNGELRDNIRKALVDNADVRTRIKVGKRDFEIRNKYYRGNPVIQIPEFELKNLESYRSKVHSEEINKDKLEGKVKIRVNEPCPCGSGKKYKKCCMSIKQ